MNKVYEVWYSTPRCNGRFNLRVLADDIKNALNKTITELDIQGKPYDITNIRIRNEYMGIK